MPDNARSLSTVLDELVTVLTAYDTAMKSLSVQLDLLGRDMKLSIADIRSAADFARAHEASVAADAN